MPLNGQDLGDAIKATVDEYAAGLEGPYTTENIEQRRADLMRAVGGAIVAYVTSQGAPSSTVPGLVPPLGVSSSGDVLRADGTWGTPTAAPHTHTMSEVTGLASSLATLAPLASPSLTGVPTAPTASAGVNTTQLATTAFVRTAIDNLVSAAPSVLDTLDELAAALGDDANFASTVTAALAGKQPIDSTLTTLSTLGASSSAGIWRQTGTSTVVRVSSSDVLDLIGSTRGALLYRGASSWAALAPGTAGKVLASGGASADPTWSSLPGPRRIRHPVGFIPTIQTDTLVIGTTQCPAWYMGTAEGPISSVEVAVRIAAAMTGISWAEVFIAKGPITMRSNPTLTVVGYTSVAVTWASATGVLTTTVSVMGGNTISAGDDWWLGFAKSSTGSPTFRAGSLGDDLQTGIIVDASGSARPSTLYNGGSPTPTTFPIAGSTVKTPWLAAQVS